jgi:hypothetical protein
MADPLLVVALALAVGGPAPARERLPFIHDDYPRALAEARSRKLPLFIEAWAPW